MNHQLLKDISKYVEDHIGEFHAARIAKLKNMNLKEILKRKNPYQIKAMRPMAVGDLVEYLVNETLCKTTNDLFEDWMKCGSVRVADNREQPLRGFSCNNTFRILFP